MKNITVILNKERLKQILTLYNISLSELLIKLNESNLKLKNPIQEKDIIPSNGEIKLSLLKKIDKILGKGLTYYIDPTPPVKTNETSIFFRKKTFNSELSIESKKTISLFEELKFTIQNLLSNVDVKLNRKLNRYSISDSPKEIAKEIIDFFVMPDRKVSDRDFFVNLVRTIEDLNVFVFEHIDHPAKKEKVVFDGFFIKPNLIILSGQKYYKREIFTLIHEFAHYLLDNEEIDSDLGETVNKESAIEKWCNEFAYYFLINKFEGEVDSLKDFSEENSFHETILDEISQKTKLSTLSLYTHLMKNNKISLADYESLSKKIKKIIQEQEVNEKKKLEEQKILAEEKGEEPPFIPLRQPLHSKLFIDILKMNYYNGDIDKQNICKYLKIKEDKVGEVLYV